MLNSFRFTRQKQRAMTAFAVMFALLMTPLLAQETPIELHQRYPTGSIQSEAMAHRALSDAKHERTSIKQRYKAEERTCYREHFFANECCSQAHKRRQQALGYANRVRIEAKRYQRRAAILKHTQNSAEKQHEPKPHFLMHPQDGAHTEALRTRQPSHTGISAHQRAANEAAYARKVQHYEARQRKIAARKAKRAAKLRTE